MIRGGGEGRGGGGEGCRHDWRIFPEYSLHGGIITVYRIVVIHASVTEWIKNRILGMCMRNPKERRGGEKRMSSPHPHACFDGMARDMGHFGTTTRSNCR